MKPTAIQADRAQRRMTIQWQDGHISTYSFALLRAGCPCAQCRGGHENMSDLPAPSIFSVQLPDSTATRLLDLLAVGSYAVSPVWEDGHADGIFRWEYLRALCPCEQCRG